MAKLKRKTEATINTLKNDLFNKFDNISECDIYIWKDGFGYWNDFMTLLGQNLRQRLIKVVFQDRELKLKYIKTINGYEEERGYINFSDIQYCESEMDNETCIIYLKTYTREYTFKFEDSQLAFKIFNLIKIYFDLVNYYKPIIDNSKKVSDLLYVHYYNMIFNDETRILDTRYFNKQ